MRRTVAILAAVLSAAPAASAAYPPKSNQIVLSARQSQRLVAYSAQLGSCLRRSGLSVSQPQATRTQIALRVGAASPQRAVIRASIGCTARIGDPPSKASLQGFRGRIVLYLPKQCLIDANVVRATH